MTLLKRSIRFLIPLFCISLPFILPARYTGNMFLRLLALAVVLCCIYVYTKGLHRVIFNERSRAQRVAVFALAVIMILFSFFVCAVSIEKEWMHSYPFENKVDDYGCYPQMFDAFQKGQLNIDTETDLSILETLENPYDTSDRREATGVTFGPTWDRAYYEGKLYSYFGIAPVIFLYYPVYFLTGKVISDALAAAVMSAIASVMMLSLMYELVSRMKSKPPFILFMLAGVALPCGALIWSTETCANFYHLAVLSGICAVVTAFYHILMGEKSDDGFRRKLHFACAGVCVGATVASRPNLVLFIFIALPLLISVIKKHENGIKSLIADIAAFSLPMIAIGVLIMIYNNARFGSPFDFGANYQLTLTDTSTYSLSSALVLPAFYHFFVHPPTVDWIFPFVHPAVNRMSEYAVTRLVYVSNSVGSFFFPCTWGVAAVGTLWRKEKRAFITAITTVLCVAFLVIFDMCYGGVHLRYAADIMFILSLLGTYILLYTIANIKKGSALYIAVFTAVAVMLLLTVLIEIPLMLDNERDMIRKFHVEFYNFLMG